MKKLSTRILIPLKSGHHLPWIGNLFSFLFTNLTHGNNLATSVQVKDQSHCIMVANIVRAYSPCSVPDAGDTSCTFS